MDMKIYDEDMEYINKSDIPWNELYGKSILIAGASGLVGNTLTEAIIYRNEHIAKNDDEIINLILIGRNYKTLEQRYCKCLAKSYIQILGHDVTVPFDNKRDFKFGSVDYIIHAASKGDPVTFVKDPVGVMNANYVGTLNLLELASKAGSKKMLFISSGEVYGKLEYVSVKGITEEQSGYVDTANPRNCYSTSKRAAENLCISYSEQYGVNVNIARLCHTYGGNILPDENRVIFQFMKNAIAGQDIVLKSSGVQKRSYCYIADAVKGIFYILLKGENKEIYNVSNENSIVSIKELAESVAKIQGKKVVQCTQGELDKKGNSGIMNAVLNNDKLRQLGYQAQIGICEGIERTMKVLA